MKELHIIPLLEQAIKVFKEIESLNFKSDINFQMKKILII
jgi:hypothetical protein